MFSRRVHAVPRRVDAAAQQFLPEYVIITGMDAELFHPLVRRWFEDRFGEPTEPQRLGWPHIAAGRHTLIAAPTGSGKTLAAFLVCIDRLLRQWLEGTLQESIQVVYISPLKALSNDIQRNLEIPLAEIAELAIAAGHEPPPIRTMVRTGDTPASQRQAMLRRPPHILVTTPESLYLMLTAQKSRRILATTRTVIVDEIHALARDKRGSHLALSLERLEALCEQAPVRIGLSATQKPIEDIARFLVGTKRVDQAGQATCETVDIGHVRALDVALEVPPSELSAVCSHEQWDEVYGRLVQLIHAHRSTLIFVNTRRLAERIAHHLTDLLGKEAVASHHGSLSKQLRQSAEERLKSGQLKAIIATASLELGIDIGLIDLVCQIGSPRSIATFLQRVGRSGHSLGLVPKGRLFPLTRDELLECLALVRAVRRGDLDRIEIPRAPLDILAQQIVAAVASEDWEEDALYELFQGAWPYHDLTRDDFDAIVKILSEGIAPGVRRGAHLHHDAIGRRLRARRGARIAALTSGGAIPETAEYRVIAQPEGTFVGKVDEDFAIESIPGDIFLLGNTSWRIGRIRGSEVLVHDAQGAPPNIPFWFGEAPGRTIELSTELSRLREDLAAHVLKSNGQNGDAAPAAWLQSECGADRWAARQAADYVAAQQAALGLVPTTQKIVFERFFDESGGMQLVIHSPLGARINRAWGLALRKRFCRSFDFELQASADDNGIVLSLSPQHSFPIENLFQMLGPHNAEPLLVQAMIAVPMFQVRWRWNVTRALAVLRQQGGSKVPPYLQRFRSDDLLAAVFPNQVGCLENHSGDIPIPDHPLVRQTVHDCLHEAMDLPRWLALLTDVGENRVQLIARDTREPSPFAHQLLNANPYAFLDGAPLEERRTRAVTTRRTLSIDDLRDLGSLDADAIAQVKREAWPLVRSADELHDALMSMVSLPDGQAGDWSRWLDELMEAGRAAKVHRPGREPIWIAAECWPIIQAAHDDARAEPPVSLPEELRRQWLGSEAWVELVRGRVQHTGPVTVTTLSDQLDLPAGHIRAALEALEGGGAVMRGHFTQGGNTSAVRAPRLPDRAALPSGRQNATNQDDEIQWCDRRLLARIHRLTLDGLRRQIQPVQPADFLRFLVRHHRLLPGVHWSGPVAVCEALAQLQGFQMPAGAWEWPVLSSRVDQYDPQWLEHLFLSGQAMWGRLRPPRREQEDGPSMAALTRTVPISLLLREDLGWLLPTDRPSAEAFARSSGQIVLEALSSRGALFFQELLSRTELLPGHLEEALRELAALGLITSDSFAAVRAIVESRSKRGKSRRRRGRKHKLSTSTSPAGRWSLFPGEVEPPSREAYLERWCRQLLRRYGVVLRDLLTRESAAPPWHQLVPVLRRLERQGEIRGGRFIARVAGEQYATEEALSQLRQIRQEPARDPWIVISAADPLNLIGIITEGPRIPATRSGTLVLQNGHCLAARHGGEIKFFTEIEPVTQAEMARALHLGHRPHGDEEPRGLTAIAALGAHRLQSR